MNFADLHESLRVELVRRIDADILSGSRLAQQTGFRQAHISNFLNRKRALSLDGLDRVLAAQNLTIPQILSNQCSRAESNLQIQAGAAETAQNSVGVQTVPLVPLSVAMKSAAIPPRLVIEQIPVSASLLSENRRRTDSSRDPWTRFLAIRADTQQAAAMDPLITPRSVVILDRHYTSLASYRSGQPNLYAVRCGGILHLRFAEFNDGRLILRPNSTAFPIHLISVPAHESPSGLIVGRICLVLNEL